MTLDEAVKACRRLGILHFKCSDFEFALGPTPPEEGLDVDKALKLKEPKRGKDGLTAAEQFDRYNQVLDASEE